MEGCGTEVEEPATSPSGVVPPLRPPGGRRRRSRGGELVGRELQRDRADAQERIVEGDHVPAGVEPFVAHALDRELTHAVTERLPGER